MGGLTYNRRMRRMALAAAALALFGASLPAMGGVEADGAAKRPKLGKVRLESFGSCAAMIR
jgi:hypothetical protein